MARRINLPFSNLIGSGYAEMAAKRQALFAGPTEEGMKTTRPRPASELAPAVAPQRRGSPPRLLERRARYDALAQMLEKSKQMKKEREKELQVAQLSARSAQNVAQIAANNSARLAKTASDEKTKTAAKMDARYAEQIVSDQKRWEAEMADKKQARADAAKLAKETATAKKTAANPLADRAAARAAGAPTTGVVEPTKRMSIAERSALDPDAIAYRKAQEMKKHQLRLLRNTFAH